MTSFYMRPSKARHSTVLLRLPTSLLSPRLILSSVQWHCLSTELSLALKNNIRQKQRTNKCICTHSTRCLNWKTPFPATHPISESECNPVTRDLSTFLHQVYILIDTLVPDVVVNVYNEANSFSPTDNPVYFMTNFHFLFFLYFPTQQSF